jgi:hypothetical protein
MITCQLCEREVNRTSKHHLKPKSRGGKHTPTADLCQPCHKTIHKTFTNKELARNYVTLESLKEAPKLQIYLAWIKNKKIEKLKF